MGIRFDQNAPFQLARYLEGHEITRAFDLGWDRFVNGELLSPAEEAVFNLLLTADKNLRYKQNLSGRKIALVVLGNSPWSFVQLHIPAIVAAVDGATEGSYAEVEIPLPPKKPFTHSS